MYTIRQAAARSGISVPLLRAWERRYGIVVPQRTAAGYRLYDDSALDRLQAMRRLVDAGWTPSTAAVAILSGQPLPPEARGEGGPVAPSGARGDVAAAPAADLVGEFVDAAASFDLDRLERVLDAMFARGTFETVAAEHLMPSLAALGEAWAAGRLGVAAEHAASHAVLRRLAAAFEAAGRPGPTRGAILVGMPPGVRHEFGALAFSTAARRAGLTIVYLGPDLPAADWVATALETAARAAVIGAVTASDVRPLVAVAEALVSAIPGLLVCFGGGAASAAAAASRVALPRAVILPEQLDAAVEALSEALHEPSAGRSRRRDRDAGPGASG